MRALYTADLHLTDLNKDDYRWHFLEDWLPAQCKMRKTQALFLLGDLTHAKDAHPASLVNRLSTALHTLSELCPVHILKGNHDYVDPANPFFGFFSHTPSRIHFYSQITSLKLGGLKWLLIPHQSQIGAKGSVYTVNNKDFLRDRSLDRVLFHQAVHGAVGANGHRVTGVGPKVFSRLSTEALIIGGDIHKPQTLRTKRGHEIRYCGSPYPIAFGDDWKFRILFEDNGALKDVFVPTIRKVVLDLKRPEELRESGLDQDDRAKVNLYLDRADFPSWPKKRKRLIAIAKEMGVELHSVSLKARPERLRIREVGSDETTTRSLSPLDTLTRFILYRGITPQLAKAGQQYLK